MLENKKIKKFISSIFAFAIIFSISYSNIVQAATGYEAYAIFRDGVIRYNDMYLNWHAGLVDEPSLDVFGPIVHISGPGDIVRYASVSEFRGGSANKIKGIYGLSLSSAQRDNIKVIGRRLVSENIGYTFLNMIGYSPSTVTGKWIYASDIVSLRCDGVVEYAYEYCGHKLQGSSTTWDISNVNDVPWHSTINTSPIKQSNTMTKYYSVE